MYVELIVYRHYMVPSLHINITEEIDVNDRHNVDYSETCGWYTYREKLYVVCTRVLYIDMR